MTTAYLGIAAIGQDSARAAVVDARGRVRATARGAPLPVHSARVEGLSVDLFDIVHDLADQLDASPTELVRAARACFAVSSNVLPYERDVVMPNVLLDAQLNFASVHMRTDAEAVLAGFTGAQPGASIVLQDTVTACATDGKSSYSGGFASPILENLGGAYTIGRALLRSAVLPPPNSSPHHVAQLLTEIERILEQDRTWMRLRKEMQHGSADTLIPSFLNRLLLYSDRWRDSVSTLAGQLLARAARNPLVNEVIDDAIDYSCTLIETAVSHVPLEGEYPVAAYWTELSSGRQFAERVRDRLKIPKERFLTRESIGTQPPEIGAAYLAICSSDQDKKDRDVALHGLRNHRRRAATARLQ